MLVEKILARGEDLPDDWPVAGTTGYDYVNAGEWYLRRSRRRAKRSKRFIPTSSDANRTSPTVVYEKKKLVMNTLLGVEMRTLGRQLAELAAQDRYARELNRDQLIDALIEVTACLPVYRTYIRNMDLPAHVDQVHRRSSCGRHAARLHILAPGASILCVRSCCC